MKKVIIIIFIFLIPVIGYFIYQDICENSPECACRDASPGDPTCMSKETLKEWCDKQKHSNELPQCKI